MNTHLRFTHTTTRTVLLAALLLCLSAGAAAAQTAGPTPLPTLPGPAGEATAESTPPVALGENTASVPGAGATGTPATGTPASGAPAALTSEGGPAAPPAFTGPFESGPRNLGRVDAESLVVRAQPSEQAAPVASLFDDEIIQIVGRNLDGSWFEVRRLGRTSSLGWVLNDYLEWTVLPETLPLGDRVTGLTGPTPLESAPPLGAFLLEAPMLRNVPLRTGGRIRALPPLITVPVLGRNADSTWLLVNYFGEQGWIIRTTVRETAGLDYEALPVPPGTPPPDTVPVVVIPIALQQAQIDRLLGFAFERRNEAAALEGFWWRVFRGEVMPCDIPPEIAEFAYTSDDVRQLPEIGRYVPRLADGVALLRAARDPLLTCGVVSPSITIEARNSAINARVIFEVSLDAISALEDRIYENR
jgi:hypothetical protein